MDSEEAGSGVSCRFKKLIADGLDEEEEGFAVGVMAEKLADEGKLLLPRPAINGGMAGRKKQKGSERKVKWNDRNGDKLAEVLEFEPSDSSGSDDDDDGAEACYCPAIFLFRFLLSASGRGKTHA